MLDTVEKRKRVVRARGRKPAVKTKLAAVLGVSACRQDYSEKL